MVNEDKTKDEEAYTEVQKVCARALEAYGPRSIMTRMAADSAKLASDTLEMIDERVSYEDFLEQVAVVFVHLTSIKVLFGSKKLDPIVKKMFDELEEAVIEQEKINAASKNNQANNGAAQGSTNVEAQSGIITDPSKVN